MAAAMKRVGWGLLALPVLALVLLALSAEGAKHGLERDDGDPTAGGGERTGQPGPSDEDGCACDIDVAGGGAYVELLKQGDEYQSMSQEQRDAYVAMAIDFITPKNAYECARNALLLESAEIALQMGAADGSLRAGELAAEYVAVMQKLEEYGVGPQDETEADPGRYFEKYDRAVERLDGGGGCGAAGAGEDGLVDEAGQGDVEGAGRDAGRTTGSIPAQPTSPLPQPP